MSYTKRTYKRTSNAFLIVIVLNVASYDKYILHGSTSYRCKVKVVVHSVIQGTDTLGGEIDQIWSDIDGQ